MVHDVVWCGVVCDVRYSTTEVSRTLVQVVGWGCVNYCHPVMLLGGRHGCVPQQGTQESKVLAVLLCVWWHYLAITNSIPP